MQKNCLQMKKRLKGLRYIVSSMVHTFVVIINNEYSQSLVYACGVRKVWTKELKDLDTPSSQITHLRKLLGDLGMNGRFTIERARAIKKKRELAQELGMSYSCVL